MNINNNQDITPYDRMDDETLRQLLGTQRSPQAGEQEQARPWQDGGQLNCRGERVTQQNEREASAPVWASSKGCDHTCGAGGGRFGMEGGKLAALYLPVQAFEELYDEDTALQRGTLFRALDLPFGGGKGGK